VVAVSLLCLAEHIPEKHLVRFSSYVSRIRLLGAILGLVMGSLVYEYIAWRGAFYSSFFFCALGMLVIPFAVELRGSRGISSWTLLKMDWLGAVLTLVGLSSFLVGISWGGTSYPWADWRVITPLSLGTCSILVLVVYQMKWAVRPFFHRNDFSTLPVLLMYTGSFLHGFTVCPSPQPSHTSHPTELTLIACIALLPPPKPNPIPHLHPLAAPPINRHLPGQHNSPGAVGSNPNRKPRIPGQPAPRVLARARRVAAHHPLHGMSGDAGRDDPNRGLDCDPRGDGHGAWIPGLGVQDVSEAGACA
jgi:hypothetical protein